MCLCVDITETEKMRKRLAKGPVTFYKVYRVFTDAIESRYQCTIVRPIRGKIESDLPKWEKETKKTGYIPREAVCHQDLIYRGIHVCLTKGGAVRCHKRKIPCNQVVPVIGKAKDFIAAGDSGDAVFTQIYVNPQEWAKMSQKAKLRR